MITRFATLSDLFLAMRRNDPAVMGPGQPGQWSTSLPVFGDPNLSNPVGVWSWDSSAAIVGACADELRMLPYRVSNGALVVELDR